METELETTKNTVMAQWGNPERIKAIQDALTLVSHHQTAVGIGFNLSHSPSTCIRCRAEISLLELGGMIRANFEEDAYAVERKENVA